MNFGTINKRIAEKISKPVLQFTKDGEFIKKWKSATQIQRELGFYGTNITRCCKGKLKSAGGYKWHYHYKSLWEKKHIPLIKQRKVA